MHDSTAAIIDFFLNIVVRVHEATRVRVLVERRHVIRAVRSSIMTVGGRLTPCMYNIISYDVHIFVLQLDFFIIVRADRLC